MANVTIPPTIQTKTFYDVRREIPVYVPDDCVSAYQNDTQWGEFNIQGIANMPTDIDRISNNHCQKTNKLFNNGQILIVRGEKVYTVTG